MATLKPKFKQHTKKNVKVVRNAFKSGLNMNKKKPRRSGK